MTASSAMTPRHRRYTKYPRLSWWWCRFQRVNYEREMEFLDILCDPKRTSLDVGAKIGMYTYRLRRHSRDVVAFEPTPILGHMLNRVFRGKNVRVEQCALSDRSGKVALRTAYGTDGEVKFGRSTIEPQNELTHDDVATVNEIEVATKTLDQFKYTDVGFMKVDVEGHEVALLKGASQTLERERPTLLVESNDHHHAGAVAKVRALLEAKGYSGRFVHGNKLVELGSVGDHQFFPRESIENFIFVHKSRPDVVARLNARF